MDEIVIDQKYSQFIENLIEQVSSVLPDDINPLQVNYLKNNMRKSMTLMASSMNDNDIFDELDFEEQCFYIQIMAEWSFHKEIDLFRSGISAKYWKVVMQKIWYTMWEVMYACAKNDSPHATTLIMVERFVNRTYKEAIEDLKEQELINEEIEEQAKEQSNIDKMAKQLQLAESIKNSIWISVKRFVLAIFLAVIIAGIIWKFKTYGLVGILTFISVYYFIPDSKKE